MLWTNASLKAACDRNQRLYYVVPKDALNLLPMIRIGNDSTNGEKTADRGLLL